MAGGQSCQSDLTGPAYSPDGKRLTYLETAPSTQRFTYGIPEIGRKMPDGRFYENTEDTPDILIRRNPDAIEEGRDAQLEAAVSTLLEQLKKP